jgi:hypothetical protein
MELGFGMLWERKVLRGFVGPRDGVCLVMDGGVSRRWKNGRMGKCGRADRRGVPKPARLHLAPVIPTDAGMVYWSHAAKEQYCGARSDVFRHS